jgi:SAM-dependent methyltransferase
MLTAVNERRNNCCDSIPFVFAATADLYYEYWGEFFHLAIFQDGDVVTDFALAFERTHEQYFNAIKGAQAERILELASGGGAFSAWMAQRTSGEVVGVDISPVQLARARKRARGTNGNLRFVEHDIMRMAELKEAPFDAAIYMDAACYLPDKGAALRGIAQRLSKRARFLLIDWCRSPQVTALQEELLLGPFYRYWCIPAMETVASYRRAFKTAGFRLIEVEDLTPRVAPNWERGYWLAIRALADGITAKRLLNVIKNVAKHGPRAVQLAKEQFYAALFAKAGCDAGVLRYVYFLAERS